MSKTKILGSLAVIMLLVAAALIAGCNPKPSETVGGFTPEILPIPPMLTTYEPMSIPPDNPMTPEKVALGRQLFFDERLSVDGTKSCYSCHVCEHGLTDGLPKAIGAGNKQLPRSSPTLWNIGYHKEFYWDGRSPSLEKQALAAWTGANMGAKADEIVAKLNALQGYKAQFQFDAAFATLVFCSVSSPVKGLAELRRVVRSGGTVVLLEHVRPGGVLGLLFDFLNLLTSNLFDDHINRRTAKTASDVGLEVVKVERSRLGIINLITCRV